jgi:hypothetical protein
LRVRKRKTEFSVRCPRGGLEEIGREDASGKLTVDGTGAREESADARFHSKRN